MNEFPSPPEGQDTGAGENPEQQQANKNGATAAKIVQRIVLGSPDKEMEVNESDGKPNVAKIRDKLVEDGKTKMTLLVPSETTIAVNEHFAEESIVINLEGVETDGGDYYFVTPELEMMTADTWQKLTKEEQEALLKRLKLIANELNIPLNDV